MGKKKIKPGLIEADSNSLAIIVNYVEEVTEEDGHVTRAQKMKKVRLSDLNADSNLSEIAEKVRYGYLVQILCAPLELPVPTRTLFFFPSQVCMLAFQSLCVCGGGGGVSSPLFFKFSSPNIHILTSFALMPLLPLFSF